jgi:hypothetical protein
LSCGQRFCAPFFLVSSFQRSHVIYAILSPARFRMSPFFVSARGEGERPAGRGYFLKENHFGSGLEIQYTRSEESANAFGAY